jgi:hypothetical protein
VALLGTFWEVGQGQITLINPSILATVGMIHHRLIHRRIHNRQVQEQHLDLVVLARDKLEDQYNCSLFHYFVEMGFYIIS